MKERKLQIIVGLMTAAVIGLIAVQIYWITIAYNIEERKFRSNVHKALSLVVEKLEKKEAADVVVKKIRTESDRAYLVKDSLSSNVVMFNSDGENDEKEFDVNVKVFSDDSLAKGYETVFTFNSTSKGKPSKKSTFTFKFDKRKLVNEVVDELLDENENLFLKENLSESEVDSLMKSEFANIGINSGFKFYVKIDDDDSVVEIGDRELRTINGSFKTQLDQGKVFGNPGYLWVDFPGEEKIIIKSLWGMLSLSAVFIIAIIFLFYKTVQLLLRQKKVSEVKNDFINNITHEFKTPISTINLACDALAESFPGSPESSEKYPVMIKKESRRLSRLVDSLLDAALMEKNGIEYKDELCDIHAIIKDAASNFNQIISRKNGRLNLELGAPRSEVYIDKFHFENAINNIIDNAIKYNADEPRISIETSGDDRKLIIKITDNGIGIPKSETEAIFGAFYRIGTGNIHNVKGYGVGLSYAKKIIAHYGGSITVDSKVGAGTTFTITLSLNDA